MFEVAKLGASLGLDASAYNKGLDDAESRAHSFGSSFTSSIQRIGEIAAGVFAGQVFTNIINGIKGIADQAIGATANMQAMQIGLESLIAREISRGEEVTRTSQVMVQLSEAELADLEKKRLAYDKMGWDVKEAFQRIWEMENRWQTSDAIEVGKAKARYNELIGKYQELGSEITALEGKQGTYATVTEKVRVNQVSMAEALAAATPRAKELMTALEDLAITSPFKTEDIQATFKQAMAFGYTAEEAKKMTAGLLNVAAGTGATNDMLQRMGYNLAQIRMVGKVTAVDFRQLAMAGFDLNAVLVEMGQQYGVSIKDYNDFNKAIESGKLKWEDFAESFKQYADKNFGGASDRMSRSLNGLKSTMSDLFVLTIPKVIGPAVEKMTEILNRFLNIFLAIRKSGILEALGKQVGDLVPKLTGPLDRLLGYLEKVKDAWVGTFTGGATDRRVAIAELKALGDVLRGSLVAVFGEGAGAIYDRVRQVIETVAAALRSVATVAGLVWERAKPLLAAFGAQAAEWVAPFVAAFGKAGDAITFLYSVLAGDFERMTSVFASARETLDRLFGEGFAVSAMRALNGLRITITNLATILVGALRSGDFSTFRTEIGAIWKSIVTWWDTNSKPLASEVAGKVGKWIGHLGTEFTTLAPTWIQNIREALTNKLFGVETFTVSDSAEGTGPSRSGGLIAAVQKQIDNLLTYIKTNAPTWAANVKTALFDGLFGVETFTMADSAEGTGPSRSGGLVAAISTWLTTVFLPSLRTAIAGLAPQVGAAIGDIFKSIPIDSYGIAGLVALLALVARTIYAVGTALSLFVPQALAAGATMATIIPAVTAVVGPLAIALGVITALGVAAFLIVKYWPQINQFFAGMATTITGALQPAIAFLQPTFDRLAQAFAGLGDQLAALQPKFAEFAAAVAPLLTMIGSAISALGRVATFVFQNGILPLLKMLATAFVAVETVIIKVLGESLTQVILHAGEIIGGLLDIATGVFEGLSTLITGVVQTVDDLLRGDWTAAWEHAKETVTGLVDSLETVLTGLVEVADGSFGTLWDTITTTVNDLLGINLPLWDQYKTGVVNSFTNLKTGATEILDGFMTFMSKMPGDIHGFFAKLPQDLYKVGRDTIEGLWDGIIAVWGSVIKRIEDLANALPDIVKKALGIASPSTVFKEIGFNLMAGLGLGLNQGFPEVMDRIAAYIRQITEKLKELAEWGGGAGGKAIESAKAVTDPIAQIFSNLNTIMSGIASINAFKTVDGLVAKATQMIEAIKTITRALADFAVWAAQAGALPGTNIAYSAKAVTDAIALVADNMVRVFPMLAGIAANSGQVEAGKLANVIGSMKTVITALVAFANDPSITPDAIATAIGVSSVFSSLAGAMSGIPAIMQALNSLATTAIGENDLTAIAEQIGTQLRTLARLFKMIAEDPEIVAFTEERAELSGRLTMLTGIFANTAQAIGVIYGAWTGVGAEFRELQRLDNGQKTGVWDRALNWLKFVLLQMKAHLAALLNAVGPVSDDLKKFADDVLALIAPFTAVSQALAQIYGVWSGVDPAFRELVRLPSGAKTGTWDKAINWLKFALLQMKAHLEAVLTAVGPISDNLKVFAERLVTIVAPFRAVLEVIGDLYAVWKGVGDEYKLLTVVDEEGTQETSGATAAIRWLSYALEAMRYQLQRLFESGAISDELAIYAARLTEITAPYRAVLETLSGLYGLWTAIGADFRVAYEDEGGAPTGPIMGAIRWLALAMQRMVYDLRNIMTDLGPIGTELQDLAGQLTNIIAPFRETVDLIADLYKTWSTAEDEFSTTRSYEGEPPTGESMQAIAWLAAAMQRMVYDLRDVLRATGPLSQDLQQLAVGLVTIVAPFKAVLDMIGNLYGLWSNASSKFLSSRSYEGEPPTGEAMSAISWLATAMQRMVYDLRLAYGITGAISVELQQFAAAIGDIANSLRNGIALLLDLSAWKQSAEVAEKAGRFVSSMRDVFVAIESARQGSIGLSVDARRFMSAMSETADAIKSGVEALTTLSAWQVADNLEAQATDLMNSLAGLLTIIENALVDIEPEAYLVAQRFGSTIGVVADGLSTALTTLIGIKDYIGPTQAALAAFMNDVLGVMLLIVSTVANWYPDGAAVDAAAAFGTAIGAVFTGLSSALTTLQGLATYTGPTSTVIGTFLNDVLGVMLLITSTVTNWYPTGPAFDAVTAFGNAMSAVFNGLLAAIQVLEGIQGYIPNTQAKINAFLGDVTYTYGLIQTYATGPGVQAGTEATSAFAGAVGAVFQALQTALGVFSQLTEGTDSDTETFKRRMAELILRINGTLTAWKIYVQDSLGAEWLPAADTFNDAISDVLGVLRSALDLFVALDEQGLPSMAQLDTFIDYVLELFSTMAAGLLDSSGEVGGAAGSVAGVISSIPGMLPPDADVRDWGSNIGWQMAGGLNWIAGYGGATGMPQQVALAAQTTGSLLYARFGPSGLLYGDMWGYGQVSGQYFLAGLANGIDPNNSYVYGALLGDAVNALIDFIRAQVNAALGIASPSQVAMQIGGLFTAGMAQGIIDGIPEVVQAGDALASALGLHSGFDMEQRIESEKRIIVEFRGQAGGGIPLAPAQFDSLKRELAYAIRIGA